MIDRLGIPCVWQKNESGHARHVRPGAVAFYTGVVLAFNKTPTGKAIVDSLERVDMLLLHSYPMRSSLSNQNRGWGTRTIDEL
jgi:hypothetical protein